jgi:XTP/dITP diphosphohydrolase
MRRILVATSNKGKLRDFAATASAHGIEIAGIQHFSELPPVIEDAPTFEENARKKAEFYSLHTNSEPVLADDSGLEVDALNGAPGIFSARYAAGPEHPNATDADNNAKLLQELHGLPDPQRTARFVCAIALAKGGKTLITVRGEAEGTILHEQRGTGGFGYDPLFYFPSLHKTFAEFTPEEKAAASHRGIAFRNLLNWLEANPAIL